MRFFEWLKSRLWREDRAVEPRPALIEFGVVEQEEERLGFGLFGSGSDLVEDFSLDTETFTSDWLDRFGGRGLER